MGSLAAKMINDRYNVSASALTYIQLWAEATAVFYEQNRHVYFENI